ncbi:MAG: LPD7 domain-containing protein, partial [Enterovibrio sp.]
RPIGFRKETAALYAQYQNEQQQLGAARRLAWQKLRYQKETHFAAAKRADKMQRSLIKVLGGGRFLQKILFAQAKESWKAQMAELRQQNLHQRQQLAAQYPRLAWADWLKQQALRGNLQALELLRSREQAQGLLGNAIMAVKAGQKLETSSLPIDNITKQGTLILRTKVGAIRDDGDKLQVSTAAGDEVIATALRLALARFGSEIDVQGTWRFREQVVRVAISGKIALSFADPELETRRRETWLQMREQEQAAVLKDDDSPKHRL